MLRFYGPVNRLGHFECGQFTSPNHTFTCLLGRLSPVMYTFFLQKLTTALLELAEGNDCRKYCMINLHERMLPTQRGLNPQPPDH